MRKRQYQSPVFLSSIPTSGSVIGDGSNQGTNIPGGMTYDEWWEEIAWGGANPDADYNGDGDVDVNDYYYYINNELWKGEE